MTKPENKNKKAKSQKPLNQYIKYSTIGFQMIALVVAGALLGDWLDGKYSEGGRLYTLVITLVSIFLALYLALKDLLKSSK